MRLRPSEDAGGSLPRRRDPHGRDRRSPSVAVVVPKPLTSNAGAHGRFDRADFVYDPGKDVYTCPAGEPLRYRFTGQQDGKTVRTYCSDACGSCAIRAMCTTGDMRRVCPALMMTFASSLARRKRSASSISSEGRHASMVRNSAARTQPGHSPRARPCTGSGHGSTSSKGARRRPLSPPSAAWRRGRERAARHCFVRKRETATGGCGGNGRDLERVGAIEALHPSSCENDPLAGSEAGGQSPSQ